MKAALSPVMIDLNVRRKERKVPAKLQRKRKNKYRFDSLPDNVQSFSRIFIGLICSRSPAMPSIVRTVNTSSIDAATVLVT
jgi:hypothetical protein